MILVIVFAVLISNKSSFGVNLPSLLFASSRLLGEWYIHTPKELNYIYIYIHIHIHIHACMHYITLRYVTLHYITFTFHSIPFHCITLHYITYHYIPLHTITYRYIPLHTITNHYIPLHTITAIRYHYIPLHTITLHYIPLHYITYIHTYPSGADVCPKFQWGFSYVVICSRYFSDCLGFAEGLFRFSFGFV